MWELKHKLRPLGYTIEQNTGMVTGNYQYLNIGGSKGDTRKVYPLSIQYVFIFMQFLEKLAKIIGSRLHFWGWCPPPTQENPESATA